MKAWVISAWRFDGASSGMWVLGVVSARLRADSVANQVQRLYALLFLSLDAQKEAAHYNNPSVLPEATISGGVDVLILESASGFLRAQLSEIIEIRSEGGREWLKWRTPRYERWSQHPTTFKLQRDGVEEPRIVEAERVCFSRALQSTMR